MAVIENLDIVLQAITKKFDQDLKDSQGIATRFARGVESAGRASLRAGAFVATGLGAAAVTAVGAASAGVAALTINIQELNQETRDFQRFGLGIDQLGTFKVLAGEAALEVEELVDFVKDLDIRIGEAIREPDGGLAETFSAMGLELEHLQALSEETPVAMARAFADAVADVDNLTLRLQYVDELTSDAGTKIINVLSRGSVAFEEAEEKAKRLGITISETDARQIQQASAALGEMRMMAQGVTTQLTVAFAPAFQVILDYANEYFDEVGGIEAATEQWAQVTVTSVGAIGDAFLSMRAVQLESSRLMIDMFANTLQFGEEIRKFPGFAEMWGVGGIDSDTIETMIGELRRESEKLGNEAAKAWVNNFSEDLERRIKEARQKARDAAGEDGPGGNESPDGNDPVSAGSSPAWAAFGTAAAASLFARLERSGRSRDQELELQRQQLGALNGIRGDLQSRDESDEVTVPILGNGG